MHSNDVRLYVFLGYCIATSLALRLGFGLLWEDVAILGCVTVGTMVWGECSFVPRGERIWNRSNRG